MSQWAAAILNLASNPGPVVATIPAGTRIPQVQSWEIHEPTTTALTGGAENISVAMVSENYFTVLGTRAIRGRVFEPTDVQVLFASPSVLIGKREPWLRSAIHTSAHCSTSAPTIW